MKPPRDPLAVIGDVLTEAYADDATPEATAETGACAAQILAALGTAGFHIVERGTGRHNATVSAEVYSMALAALHAREQDVARLRNALPEDEPVLHELLRALGWEGRGATVHDLVEEVAVLVRERREREAALAEKYKRVALPGAEAAAHG